MARLNESRIGAVITDDLAVRAATSMDSTPHAQHGAALLIGLDSDVTVTAAGGARVRGRVVVAQPHLLHAARCAGPTLGLLYDPERMPGVADYSRLHGGLFVVADRPAARIVSSLVAHRASLSRSDVLDGLGRELARGLARDESSRRPGPDPRVAAVVETLRDPNADAAAAVARAGISAAHLQALFVRDIGLSIRAFRLWRRLLAAAQSLARSDATDAAHAAGFADLAHFSRSCRRLLGYSPTTLRSRLIAT